MSSPTTVYRSAPLGKYFLIRSKLKTELILEVKDGVDKPGVAVVANEENGTSSSHPENQLWFYDSQTSTIRTKLNSFCLDIFKDSSLVVQPFIRKSPNQRWILCEDRIQTEEDFETVVTITDAKIHSPAQALAYNGSNGGDGQHWNIEYRPAPYFYIRCAEKDTKVFDVRKADQKAGAKIILFTDKGDMADNQLWYEDQTGIIHSKLNSFAIDTNGKELVLLPYDKRNEWQQWTISGNTLQNRIHPGRVLEMKPGKFMSDDSVCVADFTSGNQKQIWTFGYIPDAEALVTAGNGKHFIIRSRLTGLVLEIQDRSASVGCPVVTGFRGANDNTTVHQIFFSDQVTGTIRTNVNNFCLDITNDILVINPYDPYKKTQQWRIMSKKIFSRQQSDLVLTLNSTDASNQPGTTVSACSDDGADNQYWDITHMPAKCFFIVSQLNDKVLDVEKDDASVGAKVIMYNQKDHASPNQLWYEDENEIIRSKLNGFVLESSSTDCIRLKPFDPSNKNHYWIIVGDRMQNKYDNRIVIDIYHEKKGNGATLCSYKFSGGDHQRWTFKYL